MAVVYWKTYQGVKDGVPFGVVQTGKLTAPNAASSTGIVAAFNQRGKLLEIKADANIQYTLKAPVKTADANGALLLAGETQYEWFDNTGSDSFQLSVIEKQ